MHCNNDMQCSLRMQIQKDLARAEKKEGGDIKSITTSKA